MYDEQLEFAISQYADGSLAPSARAALDARLAEDPALRELLAEYQNIDTALAAMPAVPAIAWDRFADQISRNIAEAASADGPSPSYKMPWVRSSGQWGMSVRRIAGFAVAACVLIGVGIGLHSRTSKPANTADNTPGNTVPVRYEFTVTGPTPEVAAADARIVQEITIGPSPSIAMNEDGFRYGDSGVVSHPQRVVIASGDPPAQDTAATPY